MTGRISRAALLVAAYVALTVVVSWPFVNYSRFADATYGGDQRLIIWTLAWDNHALLNGLPLFGSNLFFPAPDSLRYNEHLFGVSLFTLPWRLAGASPVLAHNATLWLAWVLNGLCVFAFLKRLVGDGRAAFVGSLVFVASYYVMIHAHAHLHLVWTWPLPLSLLLLERWFDAPRAGRAAAWVVVVLLGVLTSWYMAVMMAMVNAVMAVTLLLTAGEADAAEAGRWRARLLHMLSACVLLAVCVYPFARHYVGLRGAPGEAAALSATVESYVIPPENTVVGRWWKANIDGRPGAIWGEQTVFAGWIGLALGVVGLLTLLRRHRESPRLWVFPALLILGFAVSLGPSPALPGGSALAPFAWLSALPGFEGMRAPARFALVAMLGLSGLTALGATWLLRGASARRLVLVLIVPVMVLEYFVVDFPAGKPRPFEVPPIYLTSQVQSARSLVSLPEYAGTPEWVLGGDYLYYSMFHWRPIVNGFGRTEPAGYQTLLAQVRDFPAHAAALRELGLQYVVVHAERYPNHGQALLDAAGASPRVRLVTRLGDDYLFELQ